MGNLYQQRIEIDLADLTERYDELDAFLKSAEFKTLSAAEQALLVKQHGIMGDYGNILKERISSGFTK